MKRMAAWSTSISLSQGNTLQVGTSTVAAERGVTYPEVENTSWGASSDGVLLRNKPVPNSTRFIGELTINEYGGVV